MPRASWCMPSQCRILSTCWNCYFLNLPSLACERCEKQGHLFKTFFLLKTFCLDHFFSRLDCAVFCFFVSLFILFVFFHSFSAFCFRMSLLFLFFNYFLCFSIFLFLYFCVSLFLSYFFGSQYGWQVFLCFFVFLFLFMFWYLPAAAWVHHVVCTTVDRSDQRTHFLFDWGSASVLPLRRALALGRQQSTDRVGATGSPGWRSGCCWSVENGCERTLLIVSSVL